MVRALGIDVGGTGIKAAIVDTAAGELVTPRRKHATPAGGEPDAIIAEVLALIEEIPGATDPALPVGIAFPTIVKHGRTLSAGNISPHWLGLAAADRFAAALGRAVTLLNDADAAAHAELRWGAAREVPGLVIVTTLGTGIGSAFLHDGVLLPNVELGHLELDGQIAEARASNAARVREELGWEEWAARLQRFYRHLERVFSPDLFIVGGGVSKQSEQFLPLLDLTTPIVPAAHRNSAGLLGAAALAAG